LVGIQAGIHAGAWTVGVVETGNSMGLSLAELNALSVEEREHRKVAIRQMFLQGGSDFVIDSVADLEPVIDIINGRLSQK